VESAALLNEKSVAERKLLMLQRQVQQLQDQSEAGLVQ
jgi:tmRNA-binding protein